jgi:hypothetical protein
VRDVSLNVTCLQSSTFVAYACMAFEVNCPNDCASGGFSVFEQVTAGTHVSAATGSDLDAPANSVMVSICSTSANNGAETQPTGWEKFTSEDTTLDLAAFEDDVSTAWTDEQGTLSTGNAVSSFCGIGAITDSGAAARPPTFLLLGVGE